MPSSILKVKVKTVEVIATLISLSDLFYSINNQATSKLAFHSNETSKDKLSIL